MNRYTLTLSLWSACTLTFAVSTALVVYANNASAVPLAVLGGVLSLASFGLFSVGGAK